MSATTISALTEIAKNFKEKTSENIKKGFESLKSVADSGTLEQLSIAMKLAQIAAPALTTVFAEINSDTMPLRVKMMQDLLTATKTPEVKEMIDHITIFFNWILAHGPEIIKFFVDLVGALNALYNFFATMPQTIPDTTTKEGAATMNAIFYGFTHPQQ